MHMIEKALIVATQAHIGQVDKGGNPYILHPISVAGRVEGDVRKVVAILHDTVEDTNVTLEQLRAEGFSEEVVEAVDSVTRRENETYMDFIHRAKENVIGSDVKIADIKDNLDLTRIAEPTDKDLGRVTRYGRALKVLEA